MERNAEVNHLDICVVKSVVNYSREQAANGADFIMHKEQVLK